MIPLNAGACIINVMLLSCIALLCFTFSLWLLLTYKCTICLHKSWTVHLITIIMLSASREGVLIFFFICNERVSHSIDTVYLCDIVYGCRAVHRCGIYSLQYLEKQHAMQITGSEWQRGEASHRQKNLIRLPSEVSIMKVSQSCTAGTLNCIMHTLDKLAQECTKASQWL